MITIKTPNKYINEPNILKSAGEYITKLGKHALIVGGKTALSVVGEEFLNSLKNSVFHDHHILFAISDSFPILFGNCGFTVILLNMYIFISSLVFFT